MDCFPEGFGAAQEFRIEVAVVLQTFPGEELVVSRGDAAHRKSSGLICSCRFVQFKTGHDCCRESDWLVRRQCASALSESHAFCLFWERERAERREICRI